MGTKSIVKIFNRYKSELEDLSEILKQFKGTIDDLCFFLSKTSHIDDAINKPCLHQ